MNKRGIIATVKKIPFFKTEFKQLVLSIFLVINLFVLLCLTKSKYSINNPFNYKILLQTGKIKKPLTDSRDYEIIRLGNGLMITLISDTESNRSGFSMTTLLGTSNKLIKYPGVTKLIQRKFVSKKLRDIIRKNTGKQKHSTSEEISSFYFDMDSAGFEEALEEIGHMLNSDGNFYKTPNSDNIIKDLRKLLKRKNQESNNNLLIDHSISPDQHNYVEGGDYDILTDGQKVQDNVAELFNIYYSPQNIKIALISNLPLSNIISICTKAFGGLKIRPNSNPDAFSRIPDEQLKLGQMIWAKPKGYKENRQLTFVLYSKEEKFKGLTPLSYFVYLLEGERPDSIYYYLGHQYHQIENVNINVQKSLTYGNKLVIKMKVRKNGDEDFKYIFKVIYGIIQSLKKSKEKRETYEDLKTIYQKRFQFLTIDKYSTYLNDISFNMLNTTNEEFSEEYLSNILYMNYDLEPYDSDVIHEYQNLLSVSNSLVFYQVENIFESYDISQIFHDYDESTPLIQELGFSYLSTNLISTDFEEEISGFAFEYWGKGKNPFLTSLDTLTLTNEEGEVRSIINEEKAKLWVRRDTTFKLPRIHSYFRFIYPEIRETDQERYKLNMYYANYLIFTFFKAFEEAKLSGNEILANVDENGLNIKVAGYKDVYIKIIRKLFDIIYRSTEVDKKNDYEYESKRYRNLEEKSLNFLGNVLKPNVNGNENQFKDFYFNNDRLLETMEYNAKHMYVESLIYGDVEEDVIAEMKRIIEEVNVSHSSKEIESKFPNKNNMEEILKYLSYTTEVKPNNIHVFRLKETYGSDGVHYFISFYQIGKRTNKADILSSLLCALFNQYVSDLIEKFEKVYKDDMIYIRIMTNSFEDTPFNMAEDFDAAIELLHDAIKDLTQEQFDNILNFVKREYNKKDMRLRHKAIKYWYEIYERTMDFRRHECIKADLERINSQEFYSEFRNWALENVWSNVKQVEFWMYHSDYDGEFEEPEDIEKKRRKQAKITMYSLFKYIDEI